MNAALRLLVISLLLSVPALCQTEHEIPSLQRQIFDASLASGAKLRLHLHEGDYRIVGSDAERISIHVAGKNVEQAKQVKIQVVHPDGAVDLKLSRLPKKDLQVTIEIPRSTNLYARMRGGDLAVEGVVGVALLLRPWPFFLTPEDSQPYRDRNVAVEFVKWVERQALARGLNVRGVARPVPLECKK